MTGGSAMREISFRPPPQCGHKNLDVVGHLQSARPRCAIPWVEMTGLRVLAALRRGVGIRRRNDRLPPLCRRCKDAVV